MVLTKVCVHQVGWWEKNQIPHARSATRTKSLNPYPITELSAPATVSLDMLTTSSATLNQMFQRFARRVTAEIDEVRKANEVGIQKIGDTLNDTLSSKIRNIQSLFEMITGVGRSGARITKTSNTSLRDWEKALDGMKSRATVIFGQDLFSRNLSLMLHWRPWIPISRISGVIFSTWRSFPCLLRLWFFVCSLPTRSFSTWMTLENCTVTSSFLLYGMHFITLIWILSVYSRRAMLQVLELGRWFMPLLVLVREN